MSHRSLKPFVLPRHYGWTLGAGKSGKVTRLKAPGSRPRTRLFRSRDASTPATSDAGGFWTDMASQLNSSAGGSKGPISCVCTEFCVCCQAVSPVDGGCLGRVPVPAPPGSAALRHDGDAMANVVARGLNKNKSRLLRLAASHSGELPPTKSDARRRWT